jgi:hypothetical protein
MGGAVGNGIDRWRLHYVVDFIHAQAGWFDFPVFNVADLGISLGATGLLLATLFGAGGHHEARPIEVMASGAAAPDASAPGADDGGTASSAAVTGAPSRSGDAR